MNAAMPTPPTGAEAAPPAAETGSPRRVAALLAPAGVLIALLLLCSLAVLRISFGEKNAEWSSWTAANYEALFNGGYGRAFIKTISLAFVSALISVICAFPIALYMARTTSGAMRRLVLICVMLPMLISLLVQSYGWMAILGPDGLLNRLLAPLTGMNRSTALLFNEAGVLFGLVQTSLPLAVLPIASALATIPQPLEEAAGVLGASRLAIYREIVLPLAWPGIVTGGLLVFAFNAGAFAVPLLLGGFQVTTVAMAIRDQMGTLLDWPLGSALSVALVVIVMAVLLGRRFIVSTSIRKS
jgi:putative spermidine/putrescine transport system permease protein